MIPHRRVCRPLVVVAAAVVAAAAGACAPSPASPRAIATLDPALAARVRSLRIVPADARLCPGKTIGATYVAVLDDGTTRSISPDVVDRAAVGAAPAADGAWTAVDDPLITMMSGFKLHAQLHGSPAVVGDTTLVPVYTCRQHSLVFAEHRAGFHGPDVTIRLSDFRTPFHSKLILASIETDSSTATNVVLDPDFDGNGALVVTSIGGVGARGTGGARGADAASGCTSGSDGGEGAPGQPGGAGGSITILSRQDVDILPAFVNARSAGGSGGDGGAGGQGGTPNSQPAPGKRCTAAVGRSGRTGAPGTGGAEGNVRTLHLQVQQLWKGSVVWRRDDQRSVMMQLLESNGISP